MTFLLAFEPEAVADLVRPMLADPGRAIAQRVDLFQVLLASIPEEQGTKDAVEQLLGGPREMGNVAITFLTQGPDSISSLRDGRYSIERTRHVSMRDVTTGQPIVPEPPAGLQAEPLLPLLESPDPRVAAQAGYLLALLERPEGLDRLIDYFHARGSSDANWMRLVYRAIARLDDGTRVPVLKEIYGKMNTDDNRGHVTEFYWTIRSMSHPDVFPLRKQIRQEIGMDQLR